MKFVSRVNNQDLFAYWGWFFTWGLILFVLGILAISAATATTLLSVIFIGMLILMSGVVILIDTFTFWWRRWSGFILHLAIGVLYSWVGIMLITNPTEGSISLTLVLGVFYIAVGVARIIYSLMLRLGRWQWSFFNGLITLMLGILITSSLASSSLFVIGLFVGIDLFVSGLTYMMSALYAKKALSN